MQIPIIGQATQAVDNLIEAFVGLWHAQQKDIDQTKRFNQVLALHAEFQKNAKLAAATGTDRDRLEAEYKLQEGLKKVWATGARGSMRKMLERDVVEEYQNSIAEASMEDAEKRAKAIDEHKRDIDSLTESMRQRNVELLYSKRTLLEWSLADKNATDAEKAAALAIFDTNVAMEEKKKVADELAAKEKERQQKAQSVLDQLRAENESLKLGENVTASIKLAYEGFSPEIVKAARAIEDENKGLKDSIELKKKATHTIESLRTKHEKYRDDLKDLVDEFKGGALSLEQFALAAFRASEGMMGKMTAPKAVRYGSAEAYSAVVQAGAQREQRQAQTEIMKAVVAQLGIKPGDIGHMVEYLRVLAGASPIFN